MATTLGWAAPRKRADETKLSQAEELTSQYGQLYGEGKYAKATPLAKRACSILEKELGGGSEKLATCLNDLAVLHLVQGEYEEAESLQERALAIRKKVLGSDHLNVAQSLNNLAGLYLEQGKYGKAEPLYERALAIRIRTLGLAHQDVAQSFNNLAEVYRAQGEYRKAEPLHEQAMAIREEALGLDHPDVAQSLNNLATLYQLQGEHVRAEPLHERALSIREKTLGSEHPDIAQSLNNLAEVCRAQGKYGKSELLHDRALAIKEKVLGPDHPSVSISLNSLALLYKVQGAYAKAEAVFERALVIRERALGPDHPEVARILDNLARLYDETGEHGKAEPMHERALAIRQRILGAHHPDVARSFNNLAESYRAQGEYRKAEPMHEQALAIREKVLGPYHPDVAHSLNDLGLLRRVQGEHGKAESYFERALAILEKMQGPDHPNVARSLDNLAGSLREKGEYGKAEAMHERALAIFEKALGPDHLDVAVGLNNLGLLHLELGRYDSAAKVRSRALGIEYEYLGRSLLFAEEHRRLDFATTIASSFDATLSAHLQAAPDHHPSAELALTTLLRRKGLVLDLSARSAATIRRSLPEEHLPLLDELSVTRDRYTALSNRGPGPLTVERFAEQLAEIQREQHRLWREIADHSPIVETLSKPVTVVDIQRALPPKGVLVEYIRYFPKYHDKAPSAPAAPRYAAYLVFPDRFDWVDLGLAETIETEATNFRRALVLKAAVSSAMYNRVIAPVLERLGEADTLFVAPDGALNLVPFAALYDGKQYLVERHPLHTLTTGRDLLHPWDTGATAKETVVVVANPTGADLGGTELEAGLLAELFPHVKTLLHDAATEAGVQSQTQPWLMHLATHGFFEVPKRDLALEAAIAEHQQSMSPSAMPFVKRAENPMMHAGLVLASDEAGDAKDTTTADGHLTAYEISGWDLRGTELVVLSACGTGLGKVESGEGVFGLRRAFTMAGAQTQVMSLWDVPDSTTAKLMDAYYRKLLAGKGRGEAMREVQLEMLRREEYRHPGHWASFVVVGEWKPLSADRLPKPEEPPSVEPAGRGCQRSSIAGDDHPGLPVLALLGLLAARRRRHSNDPTRIS